MDPNDRYPVGLRRRTPEERAAYLEARVPDTARRFNCTEDEARQILQLGQIRKPTPEKGSISFVLTRPDDETLKFSIEFAGQGGEEITTITHDQYGWDGIDLIKGTVTSIGEALGIEVVER